MMICSPCAHQTTVLVMLAYPKQAGCPVVFNETAPGYSREQCIKDIIDGQYDEIVQILEVTPGEIASDITDAIARAIVARPDFDVMSDSVINFLSSNAFNMRAASRASAAASQSAEGAVSP